MRRLRSGESKRIDHNRYRDKVRGIFRIYSQSVQSVWRLVYTLNSEPTGFHCKLFTENPHLTGSKSKWNVWVSGSVIIMTLVSPKKITDSGLVPSSDQYRRTPSTAIEYFLPTDFHRIPSTEYLQANAFYRMSSTECLLTEWLLSNAFHRITCNVFRMSSIAITSEHCVPLNSSELLRISGIPLLCIAGSQSASQTSLASLLSLSKKIKTLIWRTITYKFENFFIFLLLSLSLSLLFNNGANTKWGHRWWWPK